MDKSRDEMLGCKVRDKISGFSGIYYGYTVFLNGCARICIAAEGLHDGKPIENQWFDEAQCEETGLSEANRRLAVAASSTGGGADHPTSHAKP